VASFSATSSASRSRCQSCAETIAGRPAIAISVA
jgi:hypothetical protein